MIGTEIRITPELAIAVGKLAQEHNDSNTSVHIAYDTERDEREWYVTFDRGYGTLTYIVDDESGEARLAGMGERPAPLDPSRPTRAQDQSKYVDAGGVLRYSADDGEVFFGPSGLPEPEPNARALAAARAAVRAMQEFTDSEDVRVNGLDKVNRERLVRAVAAALKAEAIK